MPRPEPAVTALDLASPVGAEPLEYQRFASATCLPEATFLAASSRRRRCGPTARSVPSLTCSSGPPQPLSERDEAHALLRGMLVMLRPYAVEDDEAEPAVVTAAQLRWRDRLPRWAFESEGNV